MLILLAHGAGAPSTSAWMVKWRQHLATLGVTVPFDYPYMAAGRRRPDPLPALIAAHRAALDGARASVDRRDAVSTDAARAGAAGPTVLVGKSMGSRVGCHAALEEPAIAALVCLGYPLISAGKRAMRDEVLRKLRTPVLFVQGTRDALCPLDRLEPVLREMQAPHALHVVEGGDHSLAVTMTQLKAARETQDDVDARTLAAIAKFLAVHAP